MGKFERFVIKYGLAIIALVAYGMIGIALCIRWNTSWTSAGLMFAMMIPSSAYAYINGWFAGQMDEQDARVKFLRELDANRISGKTKQKTR